MYKKSENSPPNSSNRKKSTQLSSMDSSSTNSSPRLTNSCTKSKRINHSVKKPTSFSFNESVLTNQSISKSTLHKNDAKGETSAEKRTESSQNEYSSQVDEASSLCMPSSSFCVPSSLADNSKKARKVKNSDDLCLQELTDSIESIDKSMKSRSFSEKGLYSKFSCDQLQNVPNSNNDLCQINRLQKLNLDRPSKEKNEDIYSARLNLSAIKFEESKDEPIVFSTSQCEKSKEINDTNKQSTNVSNVISVSNRPTSLNVKNSQVVNNTTQMKDSNENNESITCPVLYKTIRNYSMYRNSCQINHTSMSNSEMANSNQHSMANSSSLNSLSLSHCCHNHFHHYHHHFANNTSSLFPISSYRQQNHCLKANKHNSLDLGMSSIQATTIISNHCNTENIIHSPNAAVTKLTSSSSGLPVTALTVMEMSNLSPSRVDVYNWQAFMPTLKDRMAAIFNREFLSDVHFIVGKGNSQTRFPAHKFILSVGSAVFNAMFNGLLAKANSEHNQTNETNDSNTEIELPDIEPEAFQALLRFLYLDEVQIGPETVMTTLYAAKKYEIFALEMACVDFLKANLNPDNAFMLLTQARLFDESNLADLCLETIDKHTMDSLFSDSFLDVDLDTLKLVLNRDTLRVREVSLFINVVRWAEMECTRRGLEVSGENKRKVLKEALYLIRFPLMNIEEFAMNVAQSGLLTDKEVVNLFLYYTVASKPSVPFPIEPRCCITSDECTVSRFQRTECRWGYSGTSDRIRFLTDRPIFVIGFGLFGSIHSNSEYEVMIEIIHTGSGKLIASNNTSFVSDGSDSTFRVMFNSPVEILQNTNYTACATLKGLDSYYGTNGCRTVTVNVKKYDPKNTVTFQFSYAAGCNNGTSVEDGQIPEIIFYT